MENFEMQRFAIEGTAGADKITNTVEGAVVLALGGNDTVTNSGDYVSIDGGAGNDRISLSASATGNTIVGGKGNDAIYTNGAGNLIQYGAGQGKDTIIGFRGEDSIEITSGSVREIIQSGDNVIIYVGSGTSNSITIKDVARGNLNITVGALTYIDGIIPVPSPNPNLANHIENDWDNATIYAMAGNDTVENTGNAVYVDGGIGNDRLINSGNKGYFDGGKGNDTISIGGAAVDNTIVGGAGNDAIYTNGAGNLIQYGAGQGKDTIIGFGGEDSIEITSGSITKVTQSGANVLVTVGSSANVLTLKDFALQNLDTTGGVITYTDEIYPMSLTSGADRKEIADDEATVYALGGNDMLSITGSYGYFDGGAGADTLISSGDENWLDGGAGVDRISLSSDAKGNTIVGGAGADTIWTNGAGNLIQYGKGNGKDVIVGFGGDDSIKITGGSVTRMIQSGSNVLITVGSSANVLTLKNFALQNLDTTGGVLTYTDKIYPMSLTSGADRKEIADDEATVYALAGNDTLSVTGSKGYFDGGAGNDRLINSGDNVTLVGGAGADTLISGGDENWLDSGAGTDRISLSNDAKGNTIVGGKGNDTIYTNGAGNVIQFGSGDGKDTIFGFGGEDSIQLTSGSVTKVAQSGADVLVTVGSALNVLTLKNFALQNLDTTGGVITYADKIYPMSLTSGADRKEIADDAATVYALGGNDTLISSGDENWLDGGAGNDRISLGDDVWYNTIAGGAGADTIYTNDNGNLILYSPGDGKDMIYGFGANYVGGCIVNEGDSIKIVDGEITRMLQNGRNVVVTVGSGTANVITIRDVDYRNLIVSDNVITSGSTYPPPWDTSSGADRITNEYDYMVIHALGGNDSIENSGDYVTISGDAGHDTIISSGNEGWLEGNAGNDRIFLDDDAEYNTVIGGAGADTIWTNGKGNLIQYAMGEGKDVIYGFSGDDSIEIVDGEVIRALQSGDNVFITVGGSYSVITLREANISELGLYNNIITAGCGCAPPPWLDNYIINRDDNATISAVGGNDTVLNTGDYSYIDGGTGSDRISLCPGAKGNTLIGGVGYDTIHTNGNGNLILYAADDGRDVIYGFSGDDSIEIADGEITRSVQSGDSVLVTVGSSSDVITIRYVALENLIVRGGVITYANTDGVTLDNKIRSETLTGTAYADSINNYANYVTISALDGDDRIYNGGASVQVYAGDGDDFILDEGRTTIDGGAGDDTIRSEGATRSSVYGGDGNDSILNWTNLVTIDGGDGDDTIENGGSSTYITGSGGNDSIFSYAWRFVTIEGGAGNDTIVNLSPNSAVNGGSGDDIIYLTDASDTIGVWRNTIAGGTGNDAVYFDSATTIGNIYQYNPGDGDDTLYNISDYDTISIGGDNYSTTASGSDVIVSVEGGGTINIAGAIVKEFVVYPQIDPVFTTGNGNAAVPWFAEDDTNFISNGARLDDICAENYSVTNIETDSSFENLAQISITAYDSDK